MVKLICPHCMKPVSLADDFAERQVTCPSCMKTFDAPTKYTPTVIGDPPAALRAPEPKPSPSPESQPMSPDIPTPTAPPPGLVPPVPTVAPAPHSVQPPLLPAGYRKSIGVAPSIQMVAWLPAVLLTITLFCTFFPWVGTYLGGSSVDSQGIWRAMVGSVSRNYTLEEKAPVSNSWLDNVQSDWGLLVPFMICLLFALAFAWADRGLQSLDPRKVPPLARIWPWRKVVILIFASLALLFILIQVLAGFGMERAIYHAVNNNPVVVKDREEAGVSQSRLAALENKIEQLLAQYNLERTTWLYLGVASNLFAVLAMLAHMALNWRGSDKPPPRLVIQY